MGGWCSGVWRGVVSELRSWCAHTPVSTARKARDQGSDSLWGLVPSSGFSASSLVPPTLGWSYHEMGRAVAVLLSDPVSWANVCACVCLCACSCAQTHVSECVCVDSVCN